MKFIGGKLRHMREVKGYSLSDMERMTGLKPGHLSEIENGYTNPRPDTVKKLSEALTIDQLYFYLEESRLPIDVIPDMPPELQKFIANPESTPWLALTEEAQRKGVSIEAMKKLIEILSENK